MQNFASYKIFLELLVYKNVCLKFLRQNLQKLEIVNFDKFHVICTFFDFHKVEKRFLENF